MSKVKSGGEAAVSKKTLGQRVYAHRWFYFLGVPGMIILVMFSYLPMRGLLMAFQEFDPHLGILGSRWVGLKHFEKLFSDPKFYLMLKNTLIISGLSLLTFPAPIILALLLNEVRCQKYKKSIQTAVYLPHFISWPIIASLTFLLLSKEQGAVNKLIMEMGGDAHAFLFDTGWTYPIIVLQSVWKGIGWGSIVYLAAITGIDQEMYEAARIDGANKIQQMIKITIPCIMPTVVVMLVLKMGSIISVDFEQILLVSNAMNRSQTEVFELFIYNYGIASGSTQYSYTTAVGMFKSVVNTFLVVLTNWLVTRKGYDGVF
ncbi:ABC transporter permease [Murimonas intestini]|uniref:Carbohydrate ABC transporter membrane protein 1 (CUT1 family) n=1 Tax=Murimonas intestini TaxID=1337051 RepID=A0AB73T3L1_9FIRM|nr:ABC transporter permease subunit [Murimonas intestini]MCR1841639.1 ABC transporter permease subunit [Murimonas intestini]MCR1868525.1 ABC transporter permease subunit [Murimonas intestini]MCR1886126.1 ABC transporter permease subunit [Murimonas intestini]